MTTKGRGKPPTHNDTPSNVKIEGECWKCGKRGHKKANCRSKAKDKDEKDEDKKGTRSANAAVEGKEFAFTTTFAGSTLVLGMSTMTGQEVDVYDSGHQDICHQTNTDSLPSKKSHRVQSMLRIRLSLRQRE